MGGHIIELGHRDGRFIRAGGVYVFTRRCADGRTEALFVGEAPVIAAAAGPGHPVWRRALQMGLSGLLVVLEADPDRRRRFAREMEATLQPPLNEGEGAVRREGPGARVGAAADFDFMYLNSRHSRAKTREPWSGYGAMSGRRFPPQGRE